MIGAKCYMIYRDRSERGAAMVEFAFVFPVLVMLLLLGFNLMRDTEVHMLKRDFSRSLLLSYPCAFKQSDAAKEACYKNAVANLTAYAASKYILNDVKSLKGGNFFYSIHTYTLTDIIRKDGTGKTDLAFPINQERQSDCKTSAQIRSASLTYSGGYTSPGAITPEFPKYGIDKVAPGHPLDKLPKLTVDNLFKSAFIGVADDTALRVLCTNGSITIAEVKFNLEKFFKYGSNPNASMEFYDVSYL